jgi:hypothetical protein
MFMLRNYELTRPVFEFAVFTLVAIGAFAQTPHQIQERQQAEERALQRESVARDQRQHEAQIEQMRAIDRQQAEDQREQAARTAQAQAVAAQEQLYALQQQAEQKQRAERQRQDGDRSSAPGAPAGQMSQSLPQQQAQPPYVAHWSFSNMSNKEKAGLAGLGVVLVALAFAAGIIPAKFTPKWLGRLPFRHE